MVSLTNAELKRFRISRQAKYRAWFIGAGQATYNSTVESGE